MRWKVSGRTVLFDLPALPKHGVDLRRAYKTMMDLSNHTGNKPLSSNGGERLHSFCHWAFKESGPAFDAARSARSIVRSQKAGGGGDPCIIVGGHSLWFRSFFREFLPATTDNPYCEKAKTRKLHNGGAVAFTLRSIIDASGNRQYKIVPSTVRPIFMGWS